MRCRIIPAKAKVLTIKISKKQHMKERAPGKTKMIMLNMNLMLAQAVLIINARMMLIKSYCHSDWYKLRIGEHSNKPESSR